MSSNLIEQLNQFVETVIAGQTVDLSRPGRGIAPLVEIAVELRTFPRKDFKDGLREDLQRSAMNMTATATSSARLAA